MAARAANALNSRPDHHRLNDGLHPTDGHRPRMYPGIPNICNLSCRSWPDCLVATITIFLCAGVTMLIVGFLVPRTPPFSAKKELTAREYEDLVQRYANRGFILDVVMVMGLGCLVVGAIILSTLHVVMYFKGYGIFPQFPARFQRRASCDGGNSTSSSETLVLATRTVGYGGLEETEH